MGINQPKRLIYLVRHGHIGSGRTKTFIGQTDLPLSARGIAQAGNLGAALAGSGLTRIIAGDLRRALVTAEYIAAAHGLTVEVRPELREIYLGSWEGRSFEDVKAEHPDEFNRRGRDLENFRPPGGESFLDLSQRVLPAFKDLVETWSGDLAIVTHVGVIRVILCHVLGMPLRNLFLLHHDFGAYSVLAGIKTMRLVHFNVMPPQGGCQKMGF